MARAEPMRAVRALLAGKRPAHVDVVPAKQLGWVRKNYLHRLEVPEGFRWAAEANVYPPLRCPKCGAVHFPHAATLSRCSQCRATLLEPDWQGDCPWPLEMEKHRWRT